MQSPGDNDMGKSREQRTREARAAKAEAARLAAEAEAAALAAEGATTGEGTPHEVSQAAHFETASAYATTDSEATADFGTVTDLGIMAGFGTATSDSGTPADIGTATYSRSPADFGTASDSGAPADLGTTTESVSAADSGTATEPGTATETSVGSELTDNIAKGAETPDSSGFPDWLTPPEIKPAAPEGGRVLSSLIASSPPDAGLTPPSHLVTPGAAPASATPPQYAPPRDSQGSHQPPSVPADRPIRQRIIGASQPGISAQSPATAAPSPRMIGLPNPDGTQISTGSPTPLAEAPPQPTQAPAPPQPAPVKREPRPEQGMTLEGKICRHEYVRIYQRKLKGLDRRLVATRAFLPVGFNMGDFTYLSPGSFCFCAKCRKRLFPKRTEGEKQQARVERKLLKETGAIDLMAVGKPRNKSEFDDELEDDFLDDSEEDSIFGKGPGPAADPGEEADENLDDDKLKLDIHVDELEVESVDVEDIKAEGVKLASEDDFDEACSLDVDEES